MYMTNNEPEYLRGLPMGELSDETVREYFNDPQNDYGEPEPAEFCCRECGLQHDGESLGGDTMLFAPDIEDGGEYSAPNNFCHYVEIDHQYYPSNHVYAKNVPKYTTAPSVYFQDRFCGEYVLGRDEAWCPNCRFVFHYGGKFDGRRVLPEKTNGQPHDADGGVWMNIRKFQRAIICQPKYPEDSGCCITDRVCGKWIPTDYDPKAVYGSGWDRD